MKSRAKLGTIFTDPSDYPDWLLETFCGTPVVIGGKRVGLPICINYWEHKDLTSVGYQPPSMPATPAAPQTAEQMRTWTPADADQANAEIAAQIRASGSNIPDLPAGAEDNPDDNAQSVTSALLWVAAAGALFGALYLFTSSSTTRRRK